MSRALRIEYPNACYHISSRISTQHRLLFRHQEDRKAFLSLLANTVELFQIKIYAYYLGDKDYHLLGMTPRANLSRVMRHINGLYTQYFNRAYRKTGSLFQGRYRAILIETDRYFHSCLVWIHRGGGSNPTYSRPEDPLRSSAFYCRNPGEEPDWLKLSEALVMLCSEYGDTIQNAYDAFCAQDPDPDLLAFYHNQKSGIILGSHEFYDKLRQQFQDPIKREAILWSRRDAQTVLAYKTVLQRIKKYFSITDKELYGSKRGQNNEYRKAAVYLLRQSGYTLKEIMKIMRFRTYVAACYIHRAIRREISISPQLAREIQALSTYIYNYQ